MICVIRQKGELIIALRFLLDTDVIIWHLRGNEAVERLLKEIEQEQPIGCSSLSIFEIWSGVRQKEESLTQNFLSVLHKIPVDSKIAFRASEYWQKFKKQGITIGKIDALIAATAQLYKLVLVTYNKDHYPMEDISLYEPMPELSKFK